MFHQFSIVSLTVDRPEDDLKAGTQGTILDVYERENGDFVYEVEFNVGDGLPFVITQIKENDLALIQRFEDM